MNETYLTKMIEQQPWLITVKNSGQQLFSLRDNLLFVPEMILSSFVNKNGHKTTYLFNL